MNRQVKKLWVKALRSGRYRQGANRLRQDNGSPKFCCLGVLCEVYRKENGGKWTHVKDNNAMFIHAVVDLPLTVCDWAGLNSDDPFLGSERASFLNDDGFDFDYIADRIEKYL